MLKKIPLATGIIIACLMLYALLPSCLCINETTNETSEATPANIIYLVRHAEKQHSKDKNPTLTELGHQRANNIANMLKKNDISHIYSTDYHRTQQTAKPLSDLIKVAITSYDPRDLPAFAQQLKTIQGNILVVGHSNTTPELVSLLGGQSTPIDESEYDRLYQLIRDLDGKVTTVLLTSAP